MTRRGRVGTRIFVVGSFEKPPSKKRTRWPTMIEQRTVGKKEFQTRKRNATVNPLLHPWLRIFPRVRSLFSLHRQIACFRGSVVCDFRKRPTKNALCFSKMTSTRLIARLDSRRHPAPPKSRVLFSDFRRFVAKNLLQSGTTTVAACSTRFFFRSGVVFPDCRA